MLYKLICRILVAPVVLSLCSCSNLSNKEVAFYKQLDSSLNLSNQVILSSTAARMKSLEAKMMDVNIVSSEKGKKWYTKAEAIKTSINSVYEFIEQLKVELRKLSNNNEKSTKAVNELFTSQKNDELNQKIRQCKAQLLQVDAEISSVLGSSIPLNDSKNIGIKDISVIETITKLSKLQSDLIITANMMITFCDKKMTHHYSFYDDYQLIVYGNDSHYFQGETAEIFAGMFLAKSEMTKEVIIKGKKGEKTVNGDFMVKFNVGQEVGLYRTKVQISYLDPNTGEIVTMNKNIQYEVLEKIPHWQQE